VEDVLQAAAARHLEANGANGDASKQPASLNRNGDSDEGLEDGEVEDEAAGDPASMITNQASVWHIHIVAGSDLTETTGPAACSSASDGSSNP
jgi:hypothetical protein